MRKKKTELAIVNRGFWEDDSNKVIGEALANFAEKASEKYRVAVISQSKGRLKERLAREGRCKDVRLFFLKSLTSSKSAFFLRALDAALFSCFVFLSLVCARPSRVYISTDPPVVVPFIVFIYAFIFRARYCYHLQDIHPEASDLVVALPRASYCIMQWMDVLTVRGASKIITLSEEMKAHIIKSRGYDGEVIILDNPSGCYFSEKLEKPNGFVFCGNMGRLQRIPLLVEAIQKYKKLGGSADFTFIGAGANAHLVRQLSKEVPEVNYLGPLHPDKASHILGASRWAILPIEDAVTAYAFPSKSSTYLLSGCEILAICGESTSVARWVLENGYGVVCRPEVDALVDAFFSLQNEGLKNDQGFLPESLVDKYSYSRFSSSLIDVVFSME
jgi:glycosyltransferase involved in cell wall biosynthesis